MNTRLTLTAAVATVVASIALHPLIASSTWFWEGVGAVIVVAGVGALTRLRVLPVWLCLLISASALLFYLNLVFSRRHSFGGALPTLASLAGLFRLNSAGWAEAARFAPPVPGLRAVSFLAVAGIGLAALFTDLLAVRLRKAAAAGVPLLALFSATVASKASAAPIDEAMIFSAGVAGYLALLVMDGRERIQAWGRLVSTRSGKLRVISAPQHTQPRTDREAAVDTHALAAAGRRVGVAAVTAALLIPLLIPGLKVRDLFGTGPGGSGHGGTSVATMPDPLVQMNQQLRRARPKTVLTYQTSNQNPPYLRAYALELTPTGDSWALYIQQVLRVPDSGRLPAAPGLHGAYRLQSTTVTVADAVTGGVASGPHLQNFLPMPYPPVKVDLGSGWTVDPGTLMVFSGNSVSGLKYSVVSRDVEPTAAQLRAAPTANASTVDQDASVPVAYNSLARLARQITSGASTAYDKAVKLQHWFTAPGNFTYSLNASEPDSLAGLRYFLLHSRRGFCQQFAFAFAVLARLLGIPARVAVGYTSGTPVGNNTWRVSTNDAHAWPELYFQDIGWLAWEPTPGGTGTGQATARTPSYTLPAVGGANGGNAAASGGASPAGPQSGQQGGSRIHQFKPFPPSDTSHGLGAAKHRGRQWQWLLAGLAALALALVLMPLVSRRCARLWRKMIIRRGTGRGATAASARARIRAAWLEIHDDLEDSGLGCRDNESPRAVVHRVSARLQPASREAFTRIALAEERARYAARIDDLPTLGADLSRVHRGLAASMGPRARWRARIFPASKLSVLERRAKHALDVFGWMEVATSWLSARVRPGDSADSALAG